VDNAWKAVVAALVATIGLAASLVTFLPRITVEVSSGLIDPSSPSPVSFTIANTNVVPIEHVQPMLGICTLVLTQNRDFEPDRECEGSLLTRFVRPQWAVRRLYMDERHTITIEDMIASKIGYADISIVISYTPWFLPWRREKEFRFQTRKLSDGNSIGFRDQQASEVPRNRPFRALAERANAGQPDADWQCALLSR